MKLSLNKSQDVIINPLSSPKSSSGLKINLNQSQEQRPTSASVVKGSNAKGNESKLQKIQTSNITRKRYRGDDEQPLAALDTKKQAFTNAITSKIRLSSTPTHGRKPSLVKLTSKAAFAPRLKLKSKGKPPSRPTGVGYDSEAEEAEEDPAIEENTILRMLPGADCEYIKKAIEDRKVGVQLGQGGTDITLKFLSKDARRAVISVQGHFYAAILVDLPCVVETLKSWDRKGWWKTADISQMLLVVGRVEDETMAKVAQTPNEVDEKTWQWPHGLTPPMHNVRKRRFRKRISYRTIEAAEEEVERLIAADEQAKLQKGTTSYEVLDLDCLRSQEPESECDDSEEQSSEKAFEQYAEEHAVMTEEEEEEVERGEGGVTVTEEVVEGVDDDDEEATVKRLQRELDLSVDDEEMDDTRLLTCVAALTDSKSPGIVDKRIRTGAEQGKPNNRENVRSNEAGDVEEIGIESTEHEHMHEYDNANEGEDEDEEEEEDEEDEEEAEAEAEAAEAEEDDDDDEDDESEESDEEANSTERDVSEWAQSLADQRADIAELREEIDISRAKLATTVNQTLRQRLLAKIAAVEGDLEVKRRAIGDNDDS